MRIENHGGFSREVDTVKYFGRADDVRVVFEALSDAPAVRADLVAAIRRQLDEGTLEISGASVADRLFARIEEGNAAAAHSAPGPRERGTARGGDGRR